MRTGSLCVKTFAYAILNEKFTFALSGNVVLRHTDVTTIFENPKLPLFVFNWQEHMRSGVGKVRKA